MSIEVYPRFAVIKEGEEQGLSDLSIEELIGRLEEAVKTGVNQALLKDEIEQRFNRHREREWLQEAAWIYPKDDEKFLKLLKEKLKKHFGKNCQVWQNTNVGRPEYPQYLCSADPRGIGGDTVHMWRDGQTWWPMEGDYSLNDEEMAEVILRITIIEFRDKR